MTERVWLACPLCGHDLVAVADVPAIRQLAIRCPACIDLAVTVMLERCQPANPYTPAVPEDPAGWRVQSILAGEYTPQRPGHGHRRQSRRQARRRRNRH